MAAKHKLIKWYRDRRFYFSHSFNLNNTNSSKHAESFGVISYRADKAQELLTALNKAICGHMMAAPVDYPEKLKLTGKGQAGLHAASHSFSPTRVI